MAKTRDRFAQAVANWVLNTFASEEYIERLNYVIAVGMDELDRRLEETS